MIKPIQPSIRTLPVHVLITALLTAVFILGCYPPTKVPIDTIHYGAADAKVARLLFVFLHGNGDRNSVFDKEGFVEAARARGLNADMISVDAHVGYYMNRTFLTRLKEDVIEPARARGYERIWLIGNSLGGFGSISFAREYSNEISGIVLLGPYVGDRPIIKEIRSAGGLLRWEPGDLLLKTREDDEKNMWLWFKEHGRKGQLRANDKNCPKEQGCIPKIYLGYGTNDRFTYAQDLLASLLPPEQVIAIDGGHDWSTWKKLWDLFLDRNIFSVASP